MSVCYLRFRGTCSSGNILLDSQKWKRHEEWGSVWVTAAQTSRAARDCRLGKMGSVMCESNFSRRFKEYLCLRKNVHVLVFLFVYISDNHIRFCHFLRVTALLALVGCCEVFLGKKKRFMGLLMIRHTAMWPEKNVPVIIPVILNGFTSS